MLLYPINFNIADKLCLVVGGGAVALRKAKSLLEGKAKVRVICIEAHGELRELALEKKIELFERGFAEGDLKGISLVFAATNNPAVQALIADEAARCSVLLNSATDPRVSDFHVPAHFRRGKMLVTVSTGGSSPALAKKIRQRLEMELSPDYEHVVELLSLIREEVVKLGGDSVANGKIFKKLLQQGIVELVLEANWFDIQMMLLRELPESADGVGLLKVFLEKYDRSNS